MAACAAACIDGPTTPGVFGELQVRPIYAAADRPAILGVAVESAVVVVTRPAAALTPVIDSTLAYGADTTSFGWILDLLADAESLDVTVSLRGSGALLYEGGMRVEVRDGALAAPALAAVRMAYVGPPIIASVTVSPAVDTLTALGATVTLTAQARDRDGTLISGATFTWTGTNAAAATVSAGLVTAVANGATVITATSGGHSASASVVVAQRATTVSVAPDAVTLTARGATQSLVAQPRDANGHPVAGAIVTWSSDAPGVASVDAATGVVTAVNGGAATISAASGGVTGTARVTVHPITDIVSITVSPAAATLTGLGATQAFTAVARDASGAVLSGVQFTWTSSASAVATVDAGGLARAAGHGQTVITAGAGAVTGAATLTVDLAPAIASVTVSPATATLFALGATQAFTAVARDAAGAVVPVASFAWSSTAPGVATIGASSGVATAAGHGVTTIRAAVAGVSGEAALTVDLTPTIASITVSPASATLTTVGATTQFHAVARDGAGAELPGVPFAWTSSALAVASVDPTGLASAQGHGAATIAAAAGGRQGVATLTVDLTTAVASVVVTPTSATLTALGATRQFEAHARDAGGSVLPGVEFVWTSGTPSVAVIGPTGLATAQAHGQAAIHATANGITGQAQLTVDLTTAAFSVTVSPATATLAALGATQRYTAVVRDDAGAVLPGVPVAWTSGTESVARIDPVAGVATAVGNGTAVITATAGAASGTATLTVGQVIAMVVVTPDTVILYGSFAPQQYTAQAFDANGYMVPNVTFEWTTNDPVVAIVDTTGLVTPLVYGYVKIKATADGITGFAWLFVEP